MTLALISPESEFIDKFISKLRITGDFEYLEKTTGAGLGKYEGTPWAEIWYDATIYPDKYSRTGQSITIRETPRFGVVIYGDSLEQCLLLRQSLINDMHNWVPVIPGRTITFPSMPSEASVPFDAGNNVEGLLFFFETTWEYSK